MSIIFLYLILYVTLASDVWSIPSDKKGESDFMANVRYNSDSGGRSSSDQRWREFKRALAFGTS